MQEIRERRESKCNECYHVPSIQRYSLDSNIRIYLTLASFFHICLHSTITGLVAAGVPVVFSSILIRHLMSKATVGESYDTTIGYRLPNIAIGKRLSKTFTFVYPRLTFILMLYHSPQHRRLAIEEGGVPAL